MTLLVWNHSARPIMPYLPINNLIAQFNCLYLPVTNLVGKGLSGFINYEMKCSFLPSENNALPF